MSGSPSDTPPIPPRRTRNTQVSSTIAIGDETESPNDQDERVQVEVYIYHLDDEFMNSLSMQRKFLSDHVHDEDDDDEMLRC